MSTLDTTRRRAMIEEHLTALWPPAWREGLRACAEQPFLVLSYPDRHHAAPEQKPPWVSSWHRMPSQLEGAIVRTLEYSTTHEMYYGVNLGRADCHPAPTRRLKTTDIMIVPGLLGDFDGAWGEHKGEAHHLPETLDALVAFLHTLPTPPTLRKRK
jgi:hypothetical protein